MRLLNFLFTTLMSCLLIIAMLVAVVIALYLLKILLTELFDQKGVDDFVLWLRQNIGQIVATKKERQ